MAAYIQILGDSYALANDLTIEAGRQLFAEQLLGASLMAASCRPGYCKNIISGNSETRNHG